ncbi:MAG: proliferating cell nuclear antigen (pcna) [Promethearchaeia archaeon]
MSFVLKLDNSKVLKGIVETLSSIITETEFKVTPDEFVITAIDPSRICLLELTMKKEDFDEFKCSAESKVGLNLEDLDKILKRSGSGDSIQLEFSEKEQKIKIKMQREGSSRTRTFSLALLDIDTQEIPMENLLKIEYDSKWVIPPEFLVEAIKDAEIYSEILTMKAEEGKGLIFSSTGQIGEMEYELGIDDLLEADINGVSTGSFSLTFLKSILKISSITEKLEISLKTDHPLKMIFNLLEGGQLIYFLAPRVEEPDYEDDDEDMDEF